ncbi:MAG TPA: hypothetical protein VFO39_06965 [Candidatus Sulfotelmatobacter sp.]|nr:hypothetical protein [Candidatus Sulfotelmatobacter sp.]
MKTKKALTFLSLALIGTAWADAATAVDNDLNRLNMLEGQVMVEVVGQVTNLPADAEHPFGSSIQYGYVSHVNGIPNVFMSSDPALQNESTAELTFYTEVTTRRVTVNGPFSIIVREGTTTIYLNSSPASFSNPDSFRSGTPIQASTIRQQVIVDGPEKTFTVVNSNTIVSTSDFTLDGQRYLLGSDGQIFRTHLQGVLFTRSGGAPPPTGHFAGYAIGADGKKG